MKSIINLTLLKIFRNKRNISYVLIITLLLTTLLISFSFNLSINNYIKKSIINNIEFRTLNVVPIETVDEDNIDIEHVSDVYSSSYDNLPVRIDLVSNGQISISYANNIILEKLGINKLEDNEIICPNVFYPYEEIYEYKIEKSRVINNPLGDKMVIEYDSYKIENSSLVVDKSYKKTLEIKYVYDSIGDAQLPNKCYVNKNNAKEISQNIYKNNNSQFSIYMVVDDYNNVDNVIAKLEKKGFTNIITSSSFDKNMIRLILTFSNIIFLISLISIICIGILYFKKKVNDEIPFIALLRTIGCKKRVVLKLYLTEHLLLNFISILFGLLMYAIIFIICKNYLLKSLSYIGFIVSFNSSFPLLVSLILLFVIYIVVYLGLRRMDNSNLSAYLGGV